VALAVAPPPRATGRDYILLHGIVLIWGITAVLGKLITLTPAVLTAWRTGLAALTLFLILALRRVAWPPWRDIGIMLATGLLIGLHWFLFFLGGRLGTVSGSLAGASTMALWVAMLEPLMTRRRWSGAETLLATGVTAGVMIIQFSDRGLLTGILAAGVAAIFSIINGQLIKRHPALLITALEMTGACVLCTAGAWLLQPEAGVSWWPSASDWPWVLTLALVCTVFAYSVCVWLQQRVSAFSLGIAGNLEPVYGMLLAPLVFGATEHQPLRFYLGAAVIISCVALHTWLTSPRFRRPEGVVDSKFMTP
jgi:drug/metabolite transporter (DMT)-like permease